jgi:hypothetical protein
MAFPARGQPQHQPRSRRDRRALDDAHMTWVVPEVESERALGACLDAGAPA